MGECVDTTQTDDGHVSERRNTDCNSGTDGNGDTEIEIADISYSHDPQRVLIKLAPRIESPSKECLQEHLDSLGIKLAPISGPGLRGDEICDYREQSTIRLLNPEAQSASEYLAVLAAAGVKPSVLPEPEEANDTTMRRVFPDGTPVPPSGPSDNPAAMAKALGDDALLPVAGELPAPAEPDAAEVMHARNHPEEVDAPIGTRTPTKRTRKAKATATPGTAAQGVEA
jgi:hypothetical protein